MLRSRFRVRVMDWRDSNVVLGEQMNTRGYDSSRLLASHKGVGILWPDGDTQVGADVLALTVRTYYMPNEDWQVICQRGPSTLDYSAAVRAIGAGWAERRPSRSARVRSRWPASLIISTNWAPRHQIQEDDGVASVRPHRQSRVVVGVDHPARLHHEGALPCLELRHGTFVPLPRVHQQLERTDAALVD